MTCYLDDILITAGSEKMHIQRMEYGIHLKLFKCEFLQTRIEYLAHPRAAEVLHEVLAGLIYAATSIERADTISIKVVMARE